ncbi:potassium-transporting ATPase subunit KdpC [Actinacidiphila acidipaludis]|uniref:Potassium-transporting ATPase KdpC subunit n=1 Tax=Actinacidiphila acidipaludis TaxID=2873382 RepID=A0ABS7QAK0_9ACTN|nr:potassium-transporting ATPase subunit KdpC [Streptomyces acidipaludis]MBY8879993.1 potassium-transporting ATPase subunit KdpC [Streptomyces acidipaludis]
MSGTLRPLVRRHVAALRLLLVLTVVTGVAYPLAVTGIAEAAFGHRADGSLIRQNGRVVASGLLGQSFDLPPDKGRSPAPPDPAWFQPRPSAGGYDPLASGASNLGPNNDRLIASVEQRRAAVAAFDHVRPADVPVDALTASGSGLDPDISPAYAYEQVDRVAGARGLVPSAVRGLVTAHLQGRSLGFLGQEHVNVVELNHALSRLR